MGPGTQHSATFLRLVSWPRILFSLYALIYVAGYLVDDVPREQVHLVPLSTFLMALFLAAYFLSMERQGIAGLLLVLWFLGACTYGNLAVQALPRDPGTVAIGAFPMLALGVLFVIQSLQDRERRKKRSAERTGGQGGPESVQHK